MRFDVAEDADALRSAVDAVLKARASADVVRAGWADGLTAEPVRAAWRELAASGLVAALAPEQADGLGLDISALVPALERVGHSGLPLPVVETAVVAVPLLAAANHTALPAVLAGEQFVVAELSGGSLIPFGQWAEHILLRAPNGSIRLYLRDELDLEPVATVDASRGLARLRGVPADGVPLGGAELAAAGSAPATAAWQHGVLGTAALLVGLADRMLTMTVDYVGERQQFGVPIGSFQAIKHHLADALLSVEFARPAGWAAAWALSAGAAEAGQQVASAKVLASDAADFVARTAIQCHGAIGYTTEYDLHLFAKRAWALARSWGSADSHRRELALALGLGKE